MGGKRFIQILGLLAAVSMAGFMAGSANAATIKASAIDFSYVDGPFIQAPGEQSTFEIPAEGTFHNVTATGNGPDGGVLFESETIAAGGSTPVSGTEYLTAGTYPFLCTLHPGMDGDLLVEGSGTPVKRPSISLVVPSQKLKQVKKTGKVKVKVKAGSLSNGVRVGLVSGNKKLSAPVKLNLKAGASKTLSIKLNGAGRKAVKKVKTGKKFKVSVSGTVPYGKPAKANRTLR